MKTPAILIPNQSDLPAATALLTLKAKELEAKLLEATGKSPSGPKAIAEKSHCPQFGAWHQMSNYVSELESNLAAAQPSQAAADVARNARWQAAQDRLNAIRSEDQQQQTRALIDQNIEFTESQIAAHEAMRSGKPVTPSAANTIDGRISAIMAPRLSLEVQEKAAAASGKTADDRIALRMAFRKAHGYIRGRGYVLKALALAIALFGADLTSRAQSSTGPLATVLNGGTNFVSANKTNTYYGISQDVSETPVVGVQVSAACTGPCVGNATFRLSKSLDGVTPESVPSLAIVLPLFGTTNRCVVTNFAIPDASKLFVTFGENPNAADLTNVSVQFLNKAGKVIAVPGIR